MSISVLNTNANLSGKTIVAAENADTISGLKTFNRGAAAPFAVDAASLKVANLDADKLDGLDSTAYYIKTVEGVWVAVAFNAGNFTGNGAQTWTLTVGDQSAFTYQKANKVMIVNFSLETTTVGGTPNTDLKIAIPGGFTANSQANASFFYSDNGTFGSGLIRVDAGTTFIRLLKPAFANWQASANLTSVYGQVIFETTT